jgi:hypothetical protein
VISWEPKDIIKQFDSALCILNRLSYDGGNWVSEKIYGAQPSAYQSGDYERWLSARDVVMIARQLQIQNGELSSLD